MLMFSPALSCMHVFTIQISFKFLTFNVRSFFWLGDFVDFVNEMYLCEFNTVMRQNVMKLNKNLEEIRKVIKSSQHICDLNVH